jgi:AmiR/NasT family two-component response regulator
VSVSEHARILETDGAGDGDAITAVARALLERNRQLEQALQSRVVIEQAKGMLAERLSLAPDEAFELLRRAARNHRMRVHDLARRVVEKRDTTPREIVEARR